MGFGPGQIVPVLYDPDDRSKVAVDEEAMEARARRARRKGEPDWLGWPRKNSPAEKVLHETDLTFLGPATLNRHGT
jgi:hypothetical protein